MRMPPEALCDHLDASILRSLENFPTMDANARKQAQAHWDLKTKPQGSLGKLEALVLWMASVRGDSQLRSDAFHLGVFAGSHGVAEEGVSAFPPEVNGQMVENFRAGGAGINALCRAYDVSIQIVDTGVEAPTGNIAREPAMDEEGFARAFMLGWEAIPADAMLYAVGEMGIANTTVATALIAAILREQPAALTGVGSGIDAARRAHKTEVIARALELHREAIANPWELMRILGGRELAAMSGAILRATSARIPVMLDGLIATAAAAVAFEIQPAAVAFCQAGHRSAEPAHLGILARYGLEPLLDLQMRLGEGTGAAVAMGVMRCALQAYRDMATFDGAGVSRL